jgi:HprK-related kinase A
MLMQKRGYRIRDLGSSDLATHCGQGKLYVDYGAASVRVRCPIKAFAQDFQRVYGAFPASPEDGDFADYHVELTPGNLVRTLVRPQCRFRIDGIELFDPFPARNALPLFEWGVNWSLAHRANQYVLLHSGAVASHRGAVIMAAPPGSGKSTLTAAMMFRGFRLLSDEFGVLCPDTGHMLPMLKPIGLKNQAVEIVRSRFPEAVIGSVFTKTHKGNVAHLAPNDASVDAIRQPATPALVVFPTYEAGAPLAAQRVPQEEAFGQLAFNSFNYHVLGAVGFEAVARVIESCPAYRLRYSNLDDAIDRIEELLDETHGTQTTGPQ